MNEKINLIGQIALESVPESNWDYIKLKSKNLITYSESPSMYYIDGNEKSFLASIINEDGDSIYCQDIIWQLRQEMYNENPEKGALYSFEMKISAVVGKKLKVTTRFAVVWLFQPTTLKKFK